MWGRNGPEVLHIGSDSREKVNQGRKKGGLLSLLPLEANRGNRCRSSQRGGEKVGASVVGIKKKKGGGGGGSFTDPRQRKQPCLKALDKKKKEVQLKEERITQVAGELSFSWRYL